MKDLINNLKGLIEAIECVDHREVEALNPAINEWVWSGKKAIAAIEEQPNPMPELLQACKVAKAHLANEVGEVEYVLKVLTQAIRKTEGK